MPAFAGMTDQVAYRYQIGSLADRDILTRATLPAPLSQELDNLVV